MLFGVKAGKRWTLAVRCTREIPRWPCCMTPSANPPPRVWSPFRKCVRSIEKSFTAPSLRTPGLACSSERRARLGIWSQVVRASRGRRSLVRGDFCVGLSSWRTTCQPEARCRRASAQHHRVSLWAVEHHGEHRTLLATTGWHASHPSFAFNKKHAKRTEDICSCTRTQGTCPSSTGTLELFGGRGRRMVTACRHGVGHVPRRPGW